ncbi:Hypothetical predicted protein [Olea europaea subsp. europaea]|uniref:Uncharacterized protein n=1 Tax=Olea europaea subsp. europaea TaxID=158383 RepID=A0A8S0V5I2_OLEEU|nr:Hypothetical predicted protein [Olea europaea subsp. europaea]
MLQPTMHTAGYSCLASQLASDFGVCPGLVKEDGDSSPTLRLHTQHTVTHVHWLTASIWCYCIEWKLRVPAETEFLRLQLLCASASAANPTATKLTKDSGKASMHGPVPSPSAGSAPSNNLYNTQASQHFKSPNLQQSHSTQVIHDSKCSTNSQHHQASTYNKLNKGSANCSCTGTIGQINKYNTSSRQHSNTQFLNSQHAIKIVKRQQRQS